MIELAATDPQAAISPVAIAILMMPGTIVFTRLVSQIRERGGRVSTEGFGLPDLFMGFFLAGFFALNVLMPAVAHDKAPTGEVMSPKQAIMGSLVYIVLLALIVGFLRMRKLSPLQMFGVNRMPIWKALLMGGLLIAALFPVLAVASWVTQGVLKNLIDAPVHEQDVVKVFRDAASANAQPSVIALFIMATVAAPIVEEVLFRGYFYAVFKSWAGPVASLIFTSTLFAVIHNTLAVTPALLMLAVALTVAYEWSGSLLVPITMHAVFNTAQLGYLLAQTASASPTP